MAVIAKIKETGPLLHITFEDGTILSTENIDITSSDLIGKDSSELNTESFALNWLSHQFKALDQGITALDFLSKNHAPAAQTTSYIGQSCPTSQQSLDKALSDVCVMDVTCDVSETALKNLRLGRGRFLRLRLIGEWNKDQIFNFLSMLKGLPIDCVELPQGTYDKTFQQRSLIALATRVEAHKIEEVLKNKPTLRLHLDPVLLGGVNNTFEVAARAKTLLLDPIITAPPLSGPSMLACVYLARTIDLQGHFAHDLDQIIEVENIPTLQIQAGWLID